MIKRTIFALTAILLAACGGAIATTPHPTPNLTVGPPEVSIDLTQEAIYTAHQETAEAVYTENDSDLDSLTGIMTQCVDVLHLRTPPLPRASSTAVAATCAVEMQPYEQRFATRTAIASRATPNR